MVARTHELASRLGARRAIALCRSFSGALEFRAGTWAAAERSLRDARDLYREIGAASGESLALQRLGILLTASGRLDEGHEALSEGLASAERAVLRSHCLTRVYSAMAQNRLAAGDLGAAEECIAEAEAASQRHGACHTCRTFLWPEAVRVALARGRMDEAERYAELLEQSAARYGTAAWRAIARETRARVLAAEGREAEALAALRAAQQEFATAGSPYEAAHCVEEQADVLSHHPDARPR